MKLLHAFALGFFVLILIYLGVKNQAAIVGIFNAGGGQVNTITKTLQGR